MVNEEISPPGQGINQPRWFVVTSAGYFGRIFSGFSVEPGQQHDLRMKFPGPGLGQVGRLSQVHWAT